MRRSLSCHPVCLYLVRHLFTDEITALAANHPDAP
jgi:hypothetical protein